MSTRDTEKEVLDFLESLDHLEPKETTTVPPRKPFVPFTPTAKPVKPDSGFVPFNRQSMTPQPPTPHSTPVPASPGFTSSSQPPRPSFKPTSSIPSASAGPPIPSVPIQQSSIGVKKFVPTPGLGFTPPIPSTVGPAIPTAGSAGNTQGASESIGHTQPAIQQSNYTPVVASQGGPPSVPSQTSAGFRTQSPSTQSPIPPSNPSSVGPPPVTTNFNPKEHVPIHPKTKTGYVQGYNSQAQTKVFEAPPQPIPPQNSGWDQPVEKTEPDPSQNSGWGWSSLLSTATKSLETAKNLAGNAATVVGSNETVRGFYKNVTPELEKLCI